MGRGHPRIGLGASPLGYFRVRIGRLRIRGGGRDHLGRGLLGIVVFLVGEAGALHAELLELDHPSHGERVRIEAPLCADLSAFWGGLREL